MDRTTFVRTAALAAVVTLAAASTGAQGTRELVVAGGTIEVTIAGPPPVSEQAVYDWVDTAARAVTAWLGRYPVPRVRLLVRAAGGGGVSQGTTFGPRGGRVPTIRIALGRETDGDALRDDWVLTHEMLHLGFPDLTTDDSWAEEGLSTYAEPLARVRIGNLRADRMWSDLMDGLPKGLPRTGDPGLHGTESWGRTYWGGALFWLTADIRIRERTSNRHGLDDALRGILDAGGDIRARWTLARALEAGDRALGLTVLTDLYREQGMRADAVDLRALWRQLGVRRAGGQVAYDDAAALADVRRAIARRAGPERSASTPR